MVFYAQSTSAVILMRANLRGKEEITKQFAKSYNVSQIGSRTEIKN